MIDKAEFEGNLYKYGFHFFNGYRFTDRAKEFLLDRSNYPSVDPHYEHLKFVDMGQIEDKDITDDLFDGLPEDLKELCDIYDVYWTSRMTFKGCYMEPHTDDYSHNPAMRAGPGNFVAWLCPESFTGRDFVWGAIEDLDQLPTLFNRSNNTIKYQDDPNFKVLGRMKPVTGLGVIPSKRNPLFWHAVDELTSDTPVIVIRGSMWDK